MPMASNQAGETLLVLAFNSWPLRVPGNATAVLNPDPRIKLRDAMPACATPGIVRASRSSRSARARFCSGV